MCFKLLAFKIIFCVNKIFCCQIEMHPSEKRMNNKIPSEKEHPRQKSVFTAAVSFFYWKKKDPVNFFSHFSQNSTFRLPHSYWSRKFEKVNCSTTLNTRLIQNRPSELASLKFQSMVESGAKLQLIQIHIRTLITWLWDMVMIGTERTTLITISVIWWGFS